VGNKGKPSQVTDHNDLFGTTVNLASRLRSEAQANEILVSELVRELCDRDPERFVAWGERLLKWFAEEMPVFLDEGPIVFHGDRDTVVNPVNGDQIIAQAKATANVRTTVTSGEAIETRFPAPREITESF
jgi:hypothetical protein